MITIALIFITTAWLNTTFAHPLENMELEFQRKILHGQVTHERDLLYIGNQALAYTGTEVQQYDIESGEIVKAFHDASLTHQVDALEYIEES